MLATRILQETVDDIFGDARGALVCLMPLAVWMGVVIAGAAVFGGVIATGSAAEDGRFAAEPAGPAVAALVAALVAAALVLPLLWAWSAVAWHRKVVLHEMPTSLLPRWPGGRVLGYIGRTLLVSLLVLLASIPLLILAAAIAPNGVTTEGEGATQTFDYAVGDGPSDFSLPGILVWLVMSGLLYGLLLRLSLILPAAAVGNVQGLGAVWKRTKGTYVGLFVPLGLLLSLVTSCLGLVASIVSFGGVMDILAAGIVTLLGIGVLTRLYIHFYPDPDLQAQTEASA